MLVFLNLLCGHVDLVVLHGLVRDGFDEDRMFSKRDEDVPLVLDARELMLTDHLSIRIQGIHKIGS